MRAKETGGKKFTQGEGPAPAPALDTLAGGPAAPGQTATPVGVGASPWDRRTRLWKRCHCWTGSRLLWKYSQWEVVGLFSKRPFYKPVFSRARECDVCLAVFSGVRKYPPARQGVKREGRSSIRVPGRCRQEVHQQGVFGDKWKHRCRAQVQLQADRCCWESSHSSQQGAEDGRPPRRWQRALHGPRLLALACVSS